MPKERVMILVMLGSAVLFVGLISLKFWRLLPEAEEQPPSASEPMSAPAPAHAPTNPVSALDALFAGVDNKDPDPDPRKTASCGHFWAPYGCMVRLPGGSTRMGAQKEDAAGKNYDPAAREDEGPVHEVVLTPYWMHKEEVTVYHYGKCVDAGACPRESVERAGGFFNFGIEERRYHPVNGVTWEGAQTYCRWIGGRLPSEAEWENAARMESENIYPDGGKTPACPRVIMANGCGAGATAAMPVTSNVSDAPFALAGNVWEWVVDRYNSKYYEDAPARDPMGPSDGASRVLRGGSWMTEDVAEMRVAFRVSEDPTAQMPDVGFRCVRSAVGMPE